MISIASVKIGWQVSIMQLPLTGNRDRKVDKIRGFDGGSVTLDRLKYSTIDEPY
jgi:hypothetical protein